MGQRSTHKLVLSSPAVYIIFLLWFKAQLPLHVSNGTWLREINLLHQVRTKWLQQCKHGLASVSKTLFCWHSMFFYSHGAAWAGTNVGLLSSYQQMYCTWWQNNPCTGLSLSETEHTRLSYSDTLPARLFSAVCIKILTGGSKSTLINLINQVNNLLLLCHTKHQGGWWWWMKVPLDKH